MLRPAPPVSATITASQFLKKDLGLLLLSIAIQLILGLLFGHIYDTRIFMATGYLVGTGQNPYISQDLSAVFQNLAFQNITSVGYPPPWPLLLGLVYRAVYSLIPNFLGYNLAIKIPILMANIGLAYLTTGAIKRLRLDASMARKAWIFMLLNPFLLYATMAWGQFDSIVAVLALSSLMLLDSRNFNFSAILLALAISFKPTPLPLALIPLLFLKRISIRQVLRYYGILLFGCILFCVVPFVVFGWDPAPILQGWNAHFTVGGGMSFLAFLEILRNSYQLNGTWWMVGLLWIPALAVAVFLLRRGVAGFEDLILKSTALIMVFFLTRAWLSEPNIILVLPFILILASIKAIDRRIFAVIWILPLLFSVLNTAAAQLFFPSMPAIMEQLLALAEEHRALRLVAKFIIVIPWHIAGWWIVLRCFRRVPVSFMEPAPQPKPG